jgi:hypothetical protein
VYQKRLNDWYETYQTAFGPKEGCIDKLDPCNDHITCGKLSVNDTVETPATSTADYLELKKLSYVEQALVYPLATRYKHYIQVKLNIAT